MPAKAVGIGSLERPIDRLKQELAANQRRFAKQQRRLEVLEDTWSIRIGRAAYRLRTRSRRWFPTPALPTVSSVMTILAVAGTSLPRFALSLAGTRHQL
jgi:hypothetical protein